MSFNRTQWAIIVLFAGAVLMLAVTTLGVLNPELARTTPSSTPGEGPPAAAIALSIISLLMGLANVVGLIILMTGARDYGQQHRLFAIIAFAIMLVGTALIVQASISAIGFTRSGDDSAYRTTLIVGAVRAGIAALPMSVAAWFLFKPPWRAIPAVVAAARIATGVGASLATLAHSSLGQISIQGQTVYLPQFDAPPDSGPLYLWMVGGWAASVLLAGMWGALAFASQDVMVAPVEKNPTPADPPSA